MTSNVDSLTTHKKKLETQIAQQASFASRPPGIFQGKHEINENGHCKAMTLRCGKQLEGPKVRTR